MSLNDRLEAFFRANADKWIDGKRLAQIAGGYAWRSRCSDLRTQRGMAIENRVRLVKEHAYGCPAEDLPAYRRAACTCGEPIRYKVSEYMFVSETSEQRSA